MGPIALFDKSFIQSLSLDESVFFDYFLHCSILRTGMTRTTHISSVSTKKKSGCAQCWHCVSLFRSETGWSIPTVLCESELPCSCPALLDGLSMVPAWRHSRNC